MDEWLELVITHELVHIFHEDHATNLGGVLRKVFGRVPLEWPFFPGAATPGWVVEGIATYYESELTQAGRVRGSFHEMVLRTAILEERFEDIDQTSGDSPVWPGGQRYYIYGSLFMKHLMDRHGPEAMGAFADAVAGQWIPYRLNAAARSSFGVSFSDAWEEWRADLERQYAALADSLAERAPLTRGEGLTDEGYYAWSPEPSPDGSRLAFARSDGRSDTQLRVMGIPAGERGKLVRTNGLSQFSWTPGGEILFSQLAFTDSYRRRGDLFITGLDGVVRRVTQGARLDHPDVSPAGDRAVAVQEGTGSNRLVMVDLQEGTIRPLADFQDQVLWAYPRWSPDGRWIAVSRWTAGAYFDVVILDPAGELLWVVTEDRSIDNAPAWSPDGEWLLWSSDRSGIPNLFAVSVNPRTGEPGDLLQVTNLLGGGAYPAVDPEGEWIFFSSYHADGWRLERIPFRPDQWFDPFPRHQRFSGSVDPTRLQERVEGREGPYNPMLTLRPTFWAPAYREGDHAGEVEVLQPGYGIFTSGEDLVGRHAYAFSGTYSRGPGSFNGGATYSYGGFENPVFTLSAAQSHDAGSQPWAGITQAGDTVPIFLVERERALGLSAALLRRRDRNRTTLSLSASHIWENRFFLEENLEESSRFRLSRPDVRLGEARATLAFGNARRFAFSISPEDGVGVLVRGRARRDLTLADSLRGSAGSDRSFRDFIGRITAYKGFRGPGFGNHVIGFRASGGIAAGPGADAFHFEVGGASGASMPLQFLDLGQGLLFPVRGYSTAYRFGRYAWSATLEYRFPIGLLNRGAGLFPLHLDWLSGSLFFDAGNAWGPELGIHGFQNPKRDRLASAGGELLIRTLPLWFQNLDFRVGLAFPSVEEENPLAYLRLGLSF
jgi:Tol biopolymer transport system component